MSDKEAYQIILEQIEEDLHHDQITGLYEEQLTEAYYVLLNKFTELIKKTKQ